MYPFIRDLFVRFLGFEAADVFTDTANERGDIPDLAVFAPTGVLDAKGKEIKSRWLVLEAKDESEIFLDEVSRAETFADKSKYIDLDTAWFAMVDPSCFVLRAVSTRSADYDAKRDIEIKWDDLTEEVFKHRCLEISAAHAGTNRRLQAFRDDIGHPIAEIKLSHPGKLLSQKQEEALERARNEFYLAMRTSAQLLQTASRRALDGMVTEAMAIKKLYDDFKSTYGIREFHLDPFRLAGKDDQINNRDAFKQHRKDVHAIFKAVRRNVPLARLACFTLPQYLERAKNEQDKALDLLAAETASLLLSRCMVLRFFEDHGFFGEKKYLCNGGVKAFKAMREYFGISYTRLIRDVYLEGSKIHAAVFSENELDWVLANNDQPLSVAVERSLFYLSHFDFATIEQDVLSNIYGQFLDTSQRKRLGEHYTPPDIARYIVRRMGLKKGDKVIDPACGLGTFLIEAFKVVAGDAAAKGVASFADVLTALENIRGNDLNAFSAMVAQIQMLWHLFAFRDDIKKHGFPETAITDGNSLHRQALVEGLFDAHLSEFSLVDLPEYDAVIGNPPYVRPERQEARLSKEDEAYFSNDLSPNIDLYSLFLYKAMDGWCRAANGDNRPGKTGFVLPISFCDNDDNKKLRQLFAPGGRWTILEIVDLELIGPMVFSADVVPIILIAEKRPPTAADKILLRVADERCAKFTGFDQKHVEFDLNKATQTEMPYADVFSPDGRILTKVTPERKAILDRFAGKTFDDIAQKFWQGKSKNTIQAWALKQPPANDPRDLRWEEADMIRMGAAFRGEIHQAKKGGLDVFKGENIVACQLEGDPVNQNIDVNKMDDASLWRFADILPKRGFAFHRISTALTAAPFSPANCIVLNTATLFFPKSELKNFPFDFLVLSRLYQYFFGLSQREAILFRARCNVYPTTVRRLPWTDKLAEQQDKLVKLREEFLAACENLHQREDVLLEQLKAATHISLKEIVTEAAQAKVAWSEELAAGKSVKIGSPVVYERDGLFVIQPGDDLLHWIALNDETIARCFAEGLKLQTEESLSRNVMVEIPIPTPDTLKQWQKTVADFDAKNYEQSLEGILDKLDKLVAKAFKVPDNEVEFIKSEFQTDPMLRRIRPNLPFTDRRLVGLRKNLAASDRYQKAYKTRR